VIQPRVQKTTRPQPERSCIACRQVQPKRGLVRLVRTHGGAVQIDLTGKLMGRGAYLCRRLECWEKGLRGSLLEHHLHLPQRLPADERERLLKEGLAIASATHESAKDNG